MRFVSSLSREKKSSLQALLVVTRATRLSCVSLPSLASHSLLSKAWKTKAQERVVPCRTLRKTRIRLDRTSWWRKMVTYRLRRLCPRYQKISRIRWYSRDSANLPSPKDKPRWLKGEVHANLSWKSRNLAKHLIQTNCRYLFRSLRKESTSMTRSRSNFWLLVKTT